MRGGSDAQNAAARAAGLSITAMPVGAAPPRPAPRRPRPPAEAPQIVREVPVPANGTLVIDKPLRSGQQVYARGGDVIVLAVVSFGAEVIADGNVHVYAPLRGKAIAGARGDTEARIFTHLHGSAAGGDRRHLPHHRKSRCPADVAGKPAQVRLDDKKLVIDADP